MTFIPYHEYPMYSRYTRQDPKNPGYPDPESQVTHFAAGDRTLCGIQVEPYLGHTWWKHQDVWGGLTCKRCERIAEKADYRPDGLWFTRTDAFRASSEGWNLFDTNFGMEIERDDERDTFEADEDAIDFVRLRAHQGHTHAKRALAIHELYHRLDGVELEYRGHTYFVRGHEPDLSVVFFYLKGGGGDGLTIHEDPDGDLTFQDRRYVESLD